MHVSQMSHKFIKDAREVVKTGQVVKVRVLEVDLARKRIALTMKLDAPVKPAGAAREGNGYRPAGRDERARGGGSGGAGNNAPAPQGALAAAFAKLQTKRS